MLHQVIVTPTQRAALDRRKRLMGKVVPLRPMAEAIIAKVGDNTKPTAIPNPSYQILPKFELPPPPVIPPFRVLYQTWPPRSADGTHVPLSRERIIQKIVADFYGTSLGHIKSDRRGHEYVKPRHVAMYLCTQLTKSSLPQIGQRFGGRDHTTVLHARNKIAQRLLVDDELGDEIWLLRSKIPGGHDGNS